MKEYLDRVKGLADEVAQASGEVKQAIDRRDVTRIGEVKEKLNTATNRLSVELYKLTLESDQWEVSD